MRFIVEILDIDENDLSRPAKVLAQYDDLQAGSIEMARIMGAQRYVNEHPGADPKMVYGKARPA